MFSQFSTRIQKKRRAGKISSAFPPDSLSGGSRASLIKGGASLSSRSIAAPRFFHRAVISSFRCRKQKKRGRSFSSGAKIKSRLVPTATRRLLNLPFLIIKAGQTYFILASMYFTSWSTVLMFSISSSGTSISNSSSMDISRSTTSKESASKSSERLVSGVMESSSTSNCSLKIALTFSNTIL